MSIEYVGRVSPSGFELYTSGEHSLEVQAIDTEAKLVTLNRKPEDVDELQEALEEFLLSNPVCKLSDILVVDDD